MVSLKRTIAALIVCFKPHVLLTLCILLVIAHSIIIAVQKGAGNSWRVSSQHDFTLAMTTLILIVALIWAAFFIFIVRFELRNELDSLLILFQCSKRGLRLLGVIGFHVALLVVVSLIVSATVERSIPSNIGETSRTKNKMTQINNRSQSMLPLQTETVYHLEAFIDDGESTVDLRQTAHSSSSVHQQVESFNLREARVITFKPRSHEPPAARSNGVSMIDRKYLLTVYKIWLTAIVYAFLYLIIENIVMFYADMSLVEFVHLSFLTMVAKVTGIDLSDYPAGEMLFNPLVRHRIR